MNSSVSAQLPIFSVKRLKPNTTQINEEFILQQRRS